MKMPSVFLVICVLFASVTGLSPRFQKQGGGGRFNPFSVVLVDDQPNSLSGRCRQLGGQLCGTECLRTDSFKRKFVEARVFCENSGGNLWSPMEKDLNDPFWSYRILNECPDIAFFLSTSKPFVGPYKDEDGQLLDVDGNPLDTAFFETRNAKGCMSVEFKTFRFFGCEVECTDSRELICEYNLETEKGSFFNKLG